MKNFRVNSKKTLVLALILCSTVGSTMLLANSAKAVKIGEVTSTRTRSYWNIEGNNNFTREWYTSRTIRVNNGYSFSHYTALPDKYAGLQVEKSVYYNYKTW